MATPRGPRPGNLPPNFNPNVLANNMQNLQINHPNQQHSNDLGGNATKQPPNTAPFGQHPQPFAVSPGPPPPGVFPRGHMPSNTPSQNVFPPNVMSTRPVGPPSASQHTPPFASRPPPPSIGGVSGAGVRPGPFSSSPVPPNPNQNASGPVSNGQLLSNPGVMRNGPPVPPGMGSMPGPHQQSQTLLTSGPSSHPPQMRPGTGNPPPPVAPTTMGQPPPSFSAQPRQMPPPPGVMPFPGMGASANQYPGSPYGMQTWPQRPQQVVPPPPGVGSMQQQAIFGMPPPPLSGTGPMQQQQQQMFGIPPPNLQNRSMPLMAHTGQENIDLDQIPRFAQNSSVILHDTRQDNQANPPPPATSDYIVRDTGNCSPRYLRCTVNQIPCTGDLLSTSAMQLALLVQPFALPHPSEDPIQVVDFGESGPVRCSRCKGYINPFMKFIDQGRRFICNLCGFTDETPREYVCNLGPDGRRRDAYERPELCRGTVEFVASKEYMVRDPMPAVFFFLIDVSMTAVQTGATAAACSAINQVIADLPEGPRTMVGIATFDSTIHFYNIKRPQQQLSMLIVPDIQDVYTPLQSDVIVQLAECREHLEMLLESIPTMFQNNRIADSAFGAAVKAAFLAMKSTGGKLLVFQSVLPSIGLGSLSARETEGRSNASAGEKEAHKLLQPVDKTLKTLAFEYAEYQVCIDLFITTQSYVDIASLSVFPKTTGGQVYYYYPFSAMSDSAKLYNDLRWNVTRPQGFEAVMRVRCSQGIQVHEYSGNFCKRIPTDVDLPAIDCDKAIVVSLKHDDKLQERQEFCFQSALLYTTVYGQRRIRVSTLSLPCTNLPIDLFRSADLDTQFACILKQAANEILSAPIHQVRDHTTQNCINILYAYRKFCSAVQSSGQLILPDALKLLPLYVLALHKSTGLRSDGRIDEKSFWINYVSSLTAPLVVPLVYPRMISIEYLDENELDESVIPVQIPLCSEKITDEGIYLLENGLDCFVYVGNSVPATILQQLFGISSVEEISNQFILEQYDNPLSKKLNAIVNEIRRRRCSFMRLTLCRKGDSSGTMFFSFMVDDKSASGPSYIEFLVHTHRQIQVKMERP